MLDIKLVYYANPNYKVVTEHMFVYSEHMFVELMFAEQMFVVKYLVKKCHIALRGSEYAEHT